MSLKSDQLAVGFSMCTQKSVCATNVGPFGEIGASFPDSVQLSSRSHFANIENKKIIAEIQCEKHKN